MQRAVARRVSGRIPALNRFAWGEFGHQAPLFVHRRNSSTKPLNEEYFRSRSSVESAINRLDPEGGATQKKEILAALEGAAAGRKSAAAQDDTPPISSLFELFCRLDLDENERWRFYHAVIPNLKLSPLPLEKAAFHQFFGKLQADCSTAEVCISVYTPKFLAHLA